MPPGFGVRAGGNDGPETDFDRRRQSSGAEKHAARKDQSGDPESKNLAGNAGNQGHYRFAPVSVGQVIKENLAETGVPLVATGTVSGDD